MPFKSKAQQRMMFAQHPEMAKEMASMMTPAMMRRLPEYVGPGRKKKQGRLPAFQGDTQQPMMRK